MDNPWHSLLKKLHSVRDLKEAISHVKKSGLLQPEMKKDESPQHALVAQSPAEAPQPLKVLGKNKTQSGHVIFQIGHQGAPEHYEISMDLNAKRKGMPSMAVSHKDASGNLLDRHPKMHSDYNSATKAITNHHFNKAWE
jgi:hypothetical protein